MEYAGHRRVNKLDGSTEDSFFSYTCGHCGTVVSGAVVASYSYGVQSDEHLIRWLLCPACVDGSVSTKSGVVYPGVPFGPSIQGLPPEVKSAYREARDCISFNAYTSCELICRKILMHVAVEKGADEGGSFAGYITHLENKGYVTPPMKRWVDLIREHGNRAAHVIENPSRERAESTIMFTAELLRLIYEMAHMSSKYAPETGGDAENST